MLSLPVGVVPGSTVQPPLPIQPHEPPVMPTPQTPRWIRKLTRLVEYSAEQDSRLYAAPGNKPIRVIGVSMDIHWMLS